MVFVASRSWWRWAFDPIYREGSIGIECQRRYSVSTHPLGLAKTKMEINHRGHREAADWDYGERGVLVARLRLWPGWPTSGACEASSSRSRATRSVAWRATKPSSR